MKYHFLLLLALASPLFAQRQMEALNRGVMVQRSSSTNTYIGWRLFGNDPASTSFNLYRQANGGTATKVNATPITATTDYSDNVGSTNLTNNAYTYYVKPVLNGVEQAASESYTLAANSVSGRRYISLPLRTDTGAYGPYDVKFAWVGDLDGDGDYDFIVDRQSTLGANEQFLEAYLNDGTFLWRMNMGPNSVNQYNISPGSSAISVGDKDAVTVYDLDGDGKAEVVVRTANGVTMTDAAGTQIGSVTASDNNQQFISIIDGLNGTELARGNVPNPFAQNGPQNIRAFIAYLDGKRPSVVFFGSNRAVTQEFYYSYTAWDYRNATLTQRWTLAQDPAILPGAEAHQMRIADVDNDGKDEICDIGHTIDDNGTQLFHSSIVTHGDRFHVADINPLRPGLETYMIQQLNPSFLATALYSSKDGTMHKKWYSSSVVDVGRGIAIDFTPAHLGYEMYSTQAGMYNAKCEKIFTNNAWAPEGLWWDGDLARELLDGAGSGALNPVVDKIDATAGTKGRLLTIYNDNGGVHQAYGGRAAFWGDILGDWREEIVLVSNDYSELRIYSTNTPAQQRIYTLMHNPQYRVQATTKGYVQASYVDYYLGYGMPTAVPPSPMVNKDLIYNAGAWDNGITSSWKNNSGANATFSNGNTVLFDITSPAGTVNLTGNVSPAEVHFFSPNNYTIDGTAGALTGTMPLNKSGNGTTTLTGAHSYTGTTTIWDGALNVNGSLTNSPVLVWGGTWGGGLAEGLTGGRLGGTGTVSQAVTLGWRGAITPGSGMGNAGTLTLGSSLTCQDASALNFDLSTNPSSGNDKIVVAGNFSLSGTVTVNVKKIGASLTPGTYTLVSYSGTLTGSLANISLTVPDGTPYTVALDSGSLRLTVLSTRAAGAVTWVGGNNSDLWDIAVSTNWTGASNIFANGDAVTFDDTGAAHPIVNINAAMPVSSVTINGTTNYTIQGTGSISGTGGLTKNGSGTYTLNTINTYTGPTIINSGTLAVDELADGGEPSSIGSSSNAASNLILNGGTLALSGEQTNTNRNVTLGTNGGTLSIPASVTLQISGNIGGTGSLTKTGDGILVCANANTYSGGTFINGGTVSLASDTANTSAFGSGLVTIQGGAKINMTDSFESYNTSAWNLNVPAGQAGRLNADGRVTLTGSLTGGGDFTFYTPYIRTELVGNWSAFTGRIFVVTDGDGGDFRVTSTAGWGAAELNLGPNVYAYFYNAGGTMYSDRTLNIGTLSGDATADLLGGPTAGKTVIYQVGARNEDSTYAGVIRNSTGATALTKVGTGTLTLSGANTYTGATIINAGKILVSGTSAASAHTVNNTGSLGVTGTVTGNVTVAGGGTLGGTGGIVGNVTVADGGILEHNAIGAPILAITGDLTLGANIVVKPSTGTALAPGIYTVCTYTGALTGTPTFSWQAPAGTNFQATFDTATPNVITMTLTVAPRPAAPIVWTGSSDFNWDSATTNFLYNGTDATAFKTDDTPTFNDVGNATSPILLVGSLSPTAVIVDATKNYTFSGTGSIASGYLTKSNTGSLTISNTQSYSGGTTINAGTVTIGNAAALGTGTVTMNGGTWETGAFAPANTINALTASTISGGSGGGAHGLRNITGSADLTLVANNVFDLEGDISAYSGTFNFTGTNTFRFMTSSNNGSSSANFNLGTRGLSARQGSAYNIGSLQGIAGSSLGMASNNNSSSTTYTIGGNNQPSNFAGVISDGSTSKKVVIIKTGTSSLTLGGVCTYTGSTTINDGSVIVTGSLANTTTTVATAGTLGGTGSIAGAVTCNGTLSPGNNSTGTLTISNNLTNSTTTIWSYELGSTSDRTNITGNLTLDGTVNVTAAAGFAPGSYTIATYTGTLTNNTLNVGTLPAGYTATVSATGGNVILNVVASYTPYQSWQLANFGSTTAPNAAPTADPDNDGITNLLEYVLNGNPNNSSQAILPTAMVSGNNLVFTFSRSDASEADTTQIFQHSTDLTNWTDVPIGASTSGIVNITENIGTAPDTITITLPKGTNVRLMGRLKITQP